MPRIFLKARDPISSYTHFIGAWLSVIGLVVMGVHLAVTPGVTAVTAVSCILFCLSLIALYCASSIYHFTNAAAKIQTALRKLDHAMIYVLIAGTYTPLLLTLLPRPNNLIFTAAMWAVAAAGILMKMFWLGVPRWLSTTLYILMGWAIAVDLPAVGALPCRGSCCSWRAGSPIPWAASSTWSSAPTSPNGSGSMRFSTSSSLPAASVTT